MLEELKSSPEITSWVPRILDSGDRLAVGTGAGIEVGLGSGTKAGAGMEGTRVGVVDSKTGGVDVAVGLGLAVGTAVGVGKVVGVTVGAGTGVAVGS